MQVNVAKDYCNSTPGCKTCECHLQDKTLEDGKCVNYEDSEWYKNIELNRIKWKCDSTSSKLAQRCFDNQDDCERCKVISFERSCSTTEDPSERMDEFARYTQEEEELQCIRFQVL